MLIQLNIFPVSKIGFMFLKDKFCLSFAFRQTIQSILQKNFADCHKKCQIFPASFFFHPCKRFKTKIVYLPDCYIWMKAPCAIQFLLNEIIFGLADDYVGMELTYLISKDVISLDNLLSELSSCAKKEDFRVFFCFRSGI